MGKLNLSEILRPWTLDPSNSPGGTVAPLTTLIVDSLAAPAPADQTGSVGSPYDDIVPVLAKPGPFYLAQNTGPFNGETGTLSDGGVLVYTGHIALTLAAGNTSAIIAGTILGLTVTGNSGLLVAVSDSKANVCSFNTPGKELSLERITINNGELTCGIVELSDSNVTMTDTTLNVSGTFKASDSVLEFNGIGHALGTNLAAITDCQMNGNGTLVTGSGGARFIGCTFGGSLTIDNSTGGGAPVYFDQQSWNSFRQVGGTVTTRAALNVAGMIIIGTGQVTVNNGGSSRVGPFTRLAGYVPFAYLYPVTSGNGNIWSPGTEATGSNNDFIWQFINNAESSNDNFSLIVWNDSGTPRDFDYVVFMVPMVPL